MEEWSVGIKKSPSALLHIAEFLDEDFGFDRDTTPGQNVRGWQRDYTGLPSQRKTSNCDAFMRNRSHQGREADGPHLSFCDAENPGSASLKG